MSTAINVMSWVAVGIVAAAAVACRLLPAERLDRAGVLMAPPLGGILLICFLNVLTYDASAAGQPFLAFPVLWTASHFRRGATSPHHSGGIRALYTAAGAALYDAKRAGRGRVVVAAA